MGEDDDIDWENQEDEEPISDPDFRITLRRGRLYLVHHFPMLADYGPITTFFEQRGRAGVTIADVTRHASEELGREASVVFRCLGRDPDAAREAITCWAEDVGLHHLWFPGSSVELRRLGTIEDSARVRCSGCGQNWSGRGRKFWITVWRAGCFPNLCVLCGSDLQQWTVKREAKPEEEREPEWMIPAGSTKTRAHQKSRGRRS